MSNKGGSTGVSAAASAGSAGNTAAGAAATDLEGHRYDPVMDDLGAGVIYHLRLKQTSLIKSKFCSTYFSKRFLYTWLTSVSTASCLICMHYYEWAGSITYLGAVLCSTYVLFHFGMWLDFSWKILHSTVVGALLGIGVSLVYGHPVVYEFSFFVALTIVNKCSNYDRLGKVIGSIGVLIGGLDPIINPLASNTFSFLWSTFYTQLADIIIPFLFGGVSLLVPFPLFAYYEAQSRMSVICMNISTCLGALTHAFCATEKVDLLRSVAEFLFREIDDNMAVLATLSNYVDLEERYVSPIFLLRERCSGHSPNRTEHNFSVFVKQFLVMAKPLVHELKTLDASINKLQFNKTQSKFVQYMRISMFNLSADANDMLNLIFEETNRFKLTSYHRAPVPRSLNEVPMWERILGTNILMDPQILSTQQKWAEYLNSHRAAPSTTGDEGDACLDRQLHSVEHYGVNGDVELGEVSLKPADEHSDTSSQNDEVRNAPLYASAFCSKYALLAKETEKSSKALLDSFQAARVNAVWISAPVASFQKPEKTATSLSRDFLGGIPHREVDYQSDIIENASTTYFENDNSYPSQILLADQNDDLRSENINLSTLNLFPRGAFVHRLLKIKVVYYQHFVFVLIFTLLSFGAAG
jgi:hypothetical protein